VPQICQCALDSSIAPVPVFLCHAHDERLDVGGGAWSPRLALVTTVVFLCYQLSVPGQQRLGCDDCGHLGQQFSSESFGLSGQPAALVIVEPQSSSAELLSQNAILLVKVVNDLQVALVHPPGDGNQHKPEGI
jgi:hypothetical protein